MTRLLKISVTAESSADPQQVLEAVGDFSAPLGRNEGDPPEPWFRRHDEYAGAG